MIVQLDTENADLDLASGATVLTHTPDASRPTLCQVLILIGGDKDLDGTGGDFSLGITVGGFTIQPSPQTITFSTAVESGYWSELFPVPAGMEVVATLTSPNAGDSSVEVTAYLYGVGGVSGILSLGATGELEVQG